MKAKQIYHYLLSHTDEELIKWYNSTIVEPFGDFRDQTIRENTQQAIHDITSNYDLEMLVNIFSSEKTKVSEAHKYLMLTGADMPYLITFDSFEDFLSKEGEYLCGFLEDVPDLLEELKREEN